MVLYYLYTGSLLSLQWFSTIYTLVLYYLYTVSLLSLQWFSTISTIILYYLRVYTGSLLSLQWFSTISTVVLYTDWLIKQKIRTIRNKKTLIVDLSLGHSHQVPGTRGTRGISRDQEYILQGTGVHLGTRGTRGTPRNQGYTQGPGVHLGTRDISRDQGYIQGPLLSHD